MDICQINSLQFYEIENENIKLSNCFRKQVARNECFLWYLKSFIELDARLRCQIECVFEFHFVAKHANEFEINQK